MDQERLGELRHAVLLPGGRPRVWGRETPVAPGFCSCSTIPRTMARVWIPGLREMPQLALRQHCHVTPCHKAKKARHEL